MKPHDLKALLNGLSQVEMTSPARTQGMDTAFASTPFTRLAAFNHGGVFLGRFTGEAPWERHRHGDELVQVLDGEVDLTVMTARGPIHVTLRSGGIFVVPRGLWHRSHARTEGDIAFCDPDTYRRFVRRGPAV